MSTGRFCFSLMAAALMTAMPAAATEHGSSKPAWLHEGLLLTYSWRASLAPGNIVQLREDPNGFVDPETGEKVSLENISGTSGSGWTQVTIAAIDGDKALVVKAGFGDARQAGNNQPVPSRGGESSITPMDDAAELWMSPEKIATLRTDTQRGLLVTAVRWPAAGRTVEAVSVQQMTGSFSNHVYERATGICLHSAALSRGAPPARHVVKEDTPQGDLLMTQGDYLGARDLSVPWAHEPIPDWVAKTRELHYRGAAMSRGPLPSVPNVLTIDIGFVAVHDGWVQALWRIDQQYPDAPHTPPAPGAAFFGRAQFGGPWAGPKALASMRKGQLLDEDPVTRMKTLVSSIDDESIVITAGNAVGRIDNKYDRKTGRLLATSFYDVLSQQQWAVQLQSSN